MRGQAKNASQQATVNRLLAKGWREVGMFALAVPMYYDRPFVGLPRPHVIHVRRDGQCFPCFTPLARGIPVRACNPAR